MVGMGRDSVGEKRKVGEGMEYGLDCLYSGDGERG